MFKQLNHFNLINMQVSIMGEYFSLKLDKIW